jgi:hypothetical protein
MRRRYHCGRRSCTVLTLTATFMARWWPIRVPRTRGGTSAC